jgi:hypothetical protein
MAAACPVCGSENTRTSPYNDGYEECTEHDCGADWKAGGNEKKGS